MSKQEKLNIRNKLISFASDLGFKVELDAVMQDHIDEAIEDEDLADHFDDEGNMIYEVRPAGDCNYYYRRIRVREGKSLTGQICTLIHELAHALGLGGGSYLSHLGEGYNELAAESVTEYVTQAIGINRTKKTSLRVFRYGFTGFLVSPVTQAIVNILLTEALNHESIEITPIYFEVKTVASAPASV